MGLCAKEYYDGTKFHRSIRNFMLQVRFFGLFFVFYFVLSVVRLLVFIGYNSSFLGVCFVTRFLGCSIVLVFSSAGGFVTHGLVYCIGCE